MGQTCGGSSGRTGGWRPDVDHAATAAAVATFFEVAPSGDPAEDARVVARISGFLLGDVLPAVATTEPGE